VLFFQSIAGWMVLAEATMETTSKRLTGVENTNKLILAQNSTIIGLLRQLTGGGAAATAAATSAALPEDLGRDGEFSFPFFCCHCRRHLSTNSLFSFQSTRCPCP